MREDIKAAIESAQSVGLAEHRLRQNKHSFEMVRAVLLHVAQELPDDMTMAELRDEINNHVISG